MLNEINWGPIWCLNMERHVKKTSFMLKNFIEKKLKKKK